MSEPPGRVDSRCQPEPDRARVDRRGIDAAHAHERLQAGLVRSGEPPHACCDERAVLVEQGNDVGHRGKGDEVDVAVQPLHAQRLEQLEDDTRAAELGEGIVRRPAWRRSGSRGGSRPVGDGR